MKTIRSLILRSGFAVCNAIGLFLWPPELVVAQTIHYQQFRQSFLSFEAEHYFDVAGTPESGGWINVDTRQRLTSERGQRILPTDSNVSRSAMYDAPGGLDFVDTLNYKLAFFEPGDYRVYLRYTMYDSSGATDYFDEDSLFFPVALNQPPASNGVVTLPKYDHNDATQNPPFWEGDFHWTGALQFDTGEPVIYSVTDEQFGSVLDFQISQRESGVVLDAVAFIPGDPIDAINLDHIGLPGAGAPADFSILIDPLQASMKSGRYDGRVDLNGDDKVDVQDHEAARRTIGIYNEALGGRARIWIGDVNMDGEFNSSDLVSVFSAGKFEDNDPENPETIMNSTWSDGDWNADGDFDTSDFVVAFQEGGYEQGPRPLQAHVVPEPTSCVLILFAGFIFVGGHPMKDDYRYR